jgi:predicted Zn-dependent peptidase
LGHVEALTDEEVARAQRIELASELHRFDDAENIAKAILTARAEGQTLDAYRQRFESMQRVSRADVALAGLTWIRPSDAPIAVLGGGLWIATHDLSAPGGYERAQ